MLPLVKDEAVEDGGALRVFLDMDGTLEPSPTLFFPIVQLEAYQSLMMLEEDGEEKRRQTFILYNLQPQQLRLGF